MWETTNIDFIWVLHFLTAIQRGQDIFFSNILLETETEGIKARAF